MELFFADIAVPATRNGEHEIAFADDLNVFKYFDRSATDESIHAELATTRRRVHKCGKLHRVDFDPGKEQLLIIHPAFGGGQVFKLLGIIYDIFLRMEEDIIDLLLHCRPKIRALL